MLTESISESRPPCPGIRSCFQEKVRTAGWANKLKQMIPSYGVSLIENPDLCRRVRSETAAVLNINNISIREAAK